MTAAWDMQDMQKSIVHASMPIILYISRERCASETTYDHQMVQQALALTNSLSQSILHVKRSKLICSIYSFDSRTSIKPRIYLNQDKALNPK